MRRLNIDIETFSTVDLKKAGMYKYAEKVEIMLFSYQNETMDHPICVDLTAKKHLPLNMRLPGPVYEALTDPIVEKRAFNAPFEIACIEAYFGIQLDLSQWWCTMAQSAMAGLPLSLDQSSKALNLPIKKDSTGMALIRYFCMPCKPTASNNGRSRNLPEHAPDKWEQFKNYCNQDVKTEIAVSKATEWLPIPESERRLWALDQKINRLGIKVDMKLVHNAISMDQEYQDKMIAEAIELSGIENPKSVAQVKKWLEVEEDIEIENLTKAAIPMVMKKLETAKAKRILEIRVQLSKTSVKKYTAMLNCVCSDGRIRGLFQFYGANRTGRWAGRLVQMQNLPKSKLSDKLLEAARQMVLNHDTDYMIMTFGSVPDILSQLIRTAFIPEQLAA